MLLLQLTRTPSRKLPVYSEFKNQRTAVRTLTVVRRIRGDVAALCRELQAIVGPEYPVQQKVGYIQIKGMHKPLLVEFFSSMGF